VSHYCHDDTHIGDWRAATSLMYNISMHERMDDLYLCYHLSVLRREVLYLSPWLKFILYPPDFWS